MQWGGCGDVRLDTYRQMSKLINTLRITETRFLTIGEGSSNTERIRIGLSSWLFVYLDKDRNKYRCKKKKSMCMCKYMYK